jgi:pimeloyl-ACP methyl ester carboxylesterase
LATSKRAPRIDWKNDLAKRLAAGGRMVETARGPIEIADVGKGPPVLFLHGAPGGYDQALLVYAHYELDGFRLIGPSRPGYLRTPLSVGASLSDQADAVAALLDALDIDRVPVIAHSTGCPIAIHFAARHPDRCCGLALAAGVFMPLPAARATRFALGFLAPLMQAVEWPSHGSVWFLRQVGAAMARTRKDRHVPLSLAALPVLTETLLPANLRATGLANDLKNLATLEPLPFDKVKCPVWLTHGRLDLVVAPANTKRAATHMPQAELHYGPGHHYVFYVPSVADKKGMHAFLARCAPGA